MTPRRLARAAIPLILAVLAGCDDGPPEALLTEYPLDAGRTWIYRRTLTVRLLDGSGEGFVVEDSLQVVSIGEEPPGPGRPPAHLLEVTRLRTSPGEPGRQYFLQDRVALRQVAVAPEGEDLTAFPKPRSEELPAPARFLTGPCPAGGAGGTNEETRLVLAYPLALGGAWTTVVRPYPILRRVTREEILRGPWGSARAAVIETTSYDPRFIPYTDWVGTDGLLRREAAAEVEEFAFPGHPAKERVREVFLLTAMRPPRAG